MSEDDPGSNESLNKRDSGSGDMNVNAEPFVPPPNLLPLPSSLPRPAALSGAAASSIAPGGPAASNVPTAGMVLLQKDTRPWTQAEQLQLEVAMRTVPRTDPQRWQSIAAQVAGRTAKACARRAKIIAEEVRAAKAKAEEEARQTRTVNTAAPGHTVELSTTPGEDHHGQAGTTPAADAVETTAPSVVHSEPSVGLSVQVPANRQAAARQAGMMSDPAPSTNRSDDDSHFHNLINDLAASQPPPSQPSAPQRKNASNGRLCCDCHELKPKRDFSKTQWMKPEGRCAECVKRAAALRERGRERGGGPSEDAPEAAMTVAHAQTHDSAQRLPPGTTAAPPLSVPARKNNQPSRTCTDCGEAKVRSEYSKSQWSKPDGARRRCAPCVLAAAAARQAAKSSTNGPQEGLASTASTTLPSHGASASSRHTDGSHRRGGDKDRPSDDTPPIKTASVVAAASDTGGKDTKKKRKAKLDRGMSGPLAATLPRQLAAEAYECMVCYEKVRRRQQVWDCRTCFRVFHLKCIGKWASFSNDRDDGWRCPGCQSLNTKVPTRYLCFCGRVENPSFASGNPPHTCGDPCHRPRDCGHDCTDPCHAGPCLPCPVMVPKSCFCGKSVASVRCSTEVKVTTCGETCGRPLGCGLHTCEEVCHAGPCKPCPIVESQECFCGLTESERPCGTGQAVDPSAPDVRKFSCGGVCNAALECGNHQCANPCHPGPCPPCPLLPEVVTSCPCGKTQLYTLGPRRESCLDPIETCTLPCHKPLPCFADGTGHRCEETCHHGDCPPCTETVNIPCNCGSTSATVACTEAREGLQKPQCNKTCNRKLNCSRHRCTETCCKFHNVRSSHAAAAGFEPHMCTRMCGKVLRCGKHECDQLCHRGYCPPCLHTNVDDLACHCGKTVLEPPTPCGTPKPVCSFPCAREHACNHTVRHTCHDEERCPPCVELVNKPCWGGHTTRSIRCHMSGISCGMPCARLLCCGDHACPATCHQGECEGNYDTVPEAQPDDKTTATADQGEWATTLEEEKKQQDDVSAAKVAATVSHPAGDDLDSWEDIVDEHVDTPSATASAAAGATDGDHGEHGADEAADDSEDHTRPSCGMACGRLRACGHPCPFRCHPGKPCPHVVCSVLVPVTCDCGRRTALGECGANQGRRARGDSAAVDAAKAFAAKQLAGTGFTPPVLKLKPGARLVCDAKCAQLVETAKKAERNRVMAEALGLQGADASDQVRDEYSEILVTAAKRKPALIAQLEKTYRSFVEETTAPRKALPVMKADDRQVAHELAEHYGLDSASYDPEPHRNVVIFRSEFKTPRIPHPLLSQSV
eukprot:m.176107 g.176107  ORF g.176107 m.176107 type:complete len:1315 (+) comp14114_c0_seq1:349-4293(+)